MRKREKVERSAAWHKAIRRANKALSSSDERSLVRDYVEGDVRVHEISERYGISIPTIYNILRRYGKGEIRRGRGSHADKELTMRQKRAIWKEYVSGDLSLWKLAEKHGVNEARIYSIGDELGETFRRRLSHKPKPTIYTNEEATAIWEEYVSGDLTVEDLAEKYGINMATLYDMFHRIGKTARRSGAIDIDTKESGRFKKQQRAKKLYPKRTRKA